MSCMTDLDQSLEELREECKTAWREQNPNAPLAMLINGPLRGLEIPVPDVGRSWQGSWFDDAGQQVLVTYEFADDGENAVWEYSGSKTMADIATDVANASFEEDRDHGDEPDVDLESMPALEARDFLVLDNDRRRQHLLEVSEGQVDLTNTFDSLECLVLLRHLVAAKGHEFQVEATLDFENQVSLQLDEVEQRYSEFADARDRAMAEAVVRGNAPPGTPVHRGRVTLPPRRIRRDG
jgi:hypothetical protein